MDGFPQRFEEKSEVIAYDFYYKIGDKANHPVKSHSERLGFFIIVANSKQEVGCIVKQAYKNTIVEIV